MSDGASVTHWIHEVKAGAEGEAQQRLWERYFDRLVALARSKLGGLRGWEDSEDVALSAMKTFFQRASHNRFPQLGDRTALWPLLVTITVRKAASVQRSQLAQKRDVRKNVSVEAVAGEEPTPELAQEVFDRGNHLLDVLDDDVLREVARLKLEGYTNKEIAGQIGKAVSTVERKLSLIRKQLIKQGDE